MGIIGLGIVSVMGRTLVPFPPARMAAFMSLFRGGQRLSSREKRPALLIEQRSRQDDRGGIDARGSSGFAGVLVDSRCPAVAGTRARDRLQCDLRVARRHER